MPIKILIQAGYQNKFDFTVRKENCTDGDIALAIATIKLAETTLLAELAKNIKVKREGDI